MKYRVRVRRESDKRSSDLALQMRYYAYILKSETKQVLYKGHCRNLKARIDEHNSGKTKSIRHAIPWRLIYYEEFSSRQEAIARERYFKSGAGRRFINKLDLTKEVPVPRPTG